MSDLIDTAESNSKVTGADDADLESCRSCGEPLAQPGIDGSCPKCLLVQPFAGMWDPREPPSAEEVAEALPRFRIEKELGRGALGAVYGAIDTSLNRIVAIKAMVANPDNPEFTARFECEASAMAKLNHPNIVAIYDSGTVDDLHYIVMERMDGGTLQQEIQKKKRLPVRRAIAILGQICDALDYVHSLSVIHRDVKPSNILLDRHGNAKLSDFGLVKGLRFEEFSEQALTRTDMAVGTPLYMAPEQMEWPAQADHRADIYSAGAVFYEMMTGETPKGRHRKASSYPNVPRCADLVVDRAMHKARDERYESAGTIYKDLMNRRRAVSRRWIGAAAILAIVGIASAYGMKNGEVQPKDHISAEARKGLLLGSFEEEIDLTQWEKLANFDFENGTGDVAHKQTPFVLNQGAVVEGGNLVLTEMNHSGSVKLKRDYSDPLLGLALNYTFNPEEYLAINERSMVIVDFGMRESLGVFLVSSKWDDPNPTVMLGDYQPLAPSGVIEPRLKAGSWHDVWIVLGDGYRLWIDGEPVYRSGESPSLSEWSKWKDDQIVHLRFEGFKGLVDHVRVWMKR